MGASERRQLAYEAVAECGPPHWRNREAFLPGRLGGRCDSFREVLINSL